MDKVFLFLRARNCDVTALLNMFNSTNTQSLQTACNSQIVLKCKGLSRIRPSENNQVYLFQVQLDYTN